MVLMAILSYILVSFVGAYSWKSRFKDRQMGMEKTSDTGRVFTAVLPRREKILKLGILKVLFIFRRLDILLCRVAFIFLAFLTKIFSIFRNIHMYRNFSLYIQFGSNGLSYGS